MSLRLPYPRLSFLFRISTQASLYKVGLEMAMQPAALRSDGLPASFTVRGMTTGTTFYWMGSQPLLTKEHLTEFRVVAPSRPLGYTVILDETPSFHNTAPPHLQGLVL